MSPHETLPRIPDALHRGGLVAAVRQFAEHSGHQPAVTFVDFTADPSGVPRTCTYRELDARARAVAGQLQQHSEPGARVAIVCPHELSYVVAFLACLYAGRIAVTLPQAEFHRNADRVLAAVQDSTPDLILATSATAGRVRGPLSRLRIADDQVKCADELMAGDPDDWHEFEPRHDDLAYLQYTSGSTRAPCGVRITHGNLAANIRQIVSITEYLHASVTTVNWVPFFHDMGLVLGIAVPASVGAHSVHLSPTAFVQSPYRWLKTVSDYRAIWTGGPNFAYDLCVDRITDEQRRALDLSSLEGLVNGSEVVRASSQEAFSTTFAQCGLRTDLDGPSYGLAEATLAVTAPPAGRKPQLVHMFERAALAAGVVRAGDDGPSSRPLVTCGVPLEDIDILIVDPDSGRQVDVDRIGEIWVRGPNVADGYWRHPERSREVFVPECRGRAGAPVEGPWLRTGDLGFVHKGLLFVAGRRKDLLVIDGRNHDPADVEATIEEVPDMSIGGVAVFAVTADDRERVVVLVEVARRGAQRDSADGLLVDRVRSTVARHHGIDAHEVILLPYGGIPRTSSRKVQRGRCRDLYLRGDLADK